MKIESIRIQNFRSFKDEKIELDSYTCFVGPNGSGKSTVLNALNIFFRQYKDSKTDLSRLSKDDFHHKNIEDPVKITVTFVDLSAKAKEDLSHYVRQDKLTVSSIAEYEAKLDFAEVKQYGNRLGIEDFRTYFEAEKSGVKVADLKDIYVKLQKEYTDLPNPGTKAVMAKSLNDYEVAHPENCKLILSEDQFYGISKGSNRLSPHIQWIFISGSKDVTEESEESKTSALGQLLARTVRSKINFSEKIDMLKQKTQEDYGRILDGEQAVLDDISTSLRDRLQAWAHPGINAQILWKQDSASSVKVEEPWAYIMLGERDFEGDLARFGHGLQRSFMLALLQELTVSSDESAPTLIMGIEEPEIYQHPPQARYLAETLYELSESGTQVMVCSHNPLFVPGDNFEAIRLVREHDTPSKSYVSQLRYSELAKELKNSGQKALREEGMLAKLYPSLNPVVNEMFFCNTLILTEGIEDVAYISSYLMLTSNMDDFRRYGCHIVPAGGKRKIIKPIAMAKLLGIPTYVVCDADTDKEKKSEIIQHKKENKSILSILGCPDIDEWPKTIITKNNLTLWDTNLTSIIADDLGTKWDEYLRTSYAYYGNPGDVQKNPLVIARALKSAWDDDVRSTLLIELIDSMIAFAKEAS